MTDQDEGKSLRARLSLMPYPELRKMAKESGIKANQKTSRLVRALADHVLVTPQVKEKWFASPQARAKTPTVDRRSSSGKNKSKTSRFKEFVAHNSDSWTSGASETSRSRKSINRSQLSEGANDLNETFEIIEDEEPKAKKTRTSTQRREEKILMQIDQMSSDSDGNYDSLITSHLSLTASESSSERNKPKVVTSELTLSDSSSVLQTAASEISQPKTSSPSVLPSSLTASHSSTSASRKTRSASKPVFQKLEKGNDSQSVSTDSSSKSSGERKSKRSHSKSGAKPSVLDQSAPLSAVKKLFRNSPKTTAQGSPVLPAVSTAKKAASAVKDSPKTPGDRFKKAHERNFSQMEDIGEHLSKKIHRHTQLTGGASKRLQQLATPTKKNKEIDQKEKGTAGKSRIAKPVKKPEIKAANLPPKPATPGRLNFKFGAASPSSFRFGKQQEQSSKSKPKGAENKENKKSAPVKAEPRPTRACRANNAVVEQALLQAQKPKHKTPAKNTKKLEATSTGKRLEYDAQSASKTRPDGYTPKTGPLKPYVDTRTMSYEQMESVKAAVKRGEGHKAFITQQHKRQTNDSKREANRAEQTKRRANARQKLVMEKREK